MSVKFPLLQLPCIKINMFNNECWEETSFHVVAKCPALARQRYDLLGSIYLSKPLNWSQAKLLCFPRETSMGKIL
jgi:hypothetical protein